MSERKPTVTRMERLTKDTFFQLRIARDLLALAKLEAERDHRATGATTQASVSRWIRDLVAAELRRRGVLR